MTPTCLSLCVCRPQDIDANMADKSRLAAESELNAFKTMMVGVSEGRGGE